MNGKLAMILILTGITIIFIIQNVAAVEVTFLIWSISMSRSLLIFITLATGFALGWFLHGYFTHRRAKDHFPDVI